MEDIKNRKYIVLLILGLVLCANAAAQAVVPELPSNSGEKLRLFTDRNMYCVSENIYFSAFYRKPDGTGSEAWSTALYAELIRWDGTKLAQAKVRIADGFAGGFLTIPEDIKSGVYYVRVYTRWMRNYSPYTYCYLPIKIVNPHGNGIDTGPDNQDSGISIRIADSAINQESILLSGIKKSYGTRELAEIEIDIKDKRLTGPYCLSVARLGSNDPGNRSISFRAMKEESNNKVIEYLPELNYLTLEGQVVNRDTKLPLVSEEVILTSTLDPFYFSIENTDSNGNFLFSLPGYEGAHQFCLTTRLENSSGVEFLVSNDFCMQPVTLPYFPFILNLEEEKLVKDLAVNAQLQAKFKPSVSEENEQSGYFPFYGKAIETKYIHDYIELIDLEEFFFELVNNVIVDKKKGKSFLRLIESGSLASHPPLILLDNIPVQNKAELLGISTTRFERIEVINGGYIFGKFMFSGLISIYSNKRDLAGLDLSNNYQFFPYQLFQGNNNYPVQADKNTGRSAEMLNLLYWQPRLEIPGTGAKGISFYTGDAPGRYLVTLSGIGNAGNEVICKQAEFSIDY